MHPGPPPSGLELCKVETPRVLASLARVDEICDHELRELVRYEHPDVIEAAKASSPVESRSSRRAS